ncbi:MAG: P-loop containing nucleoside triphosphate hydrolase protein [Piptocephalis tieghemiana]|nr:MAG: P-loop containing nucleoside triphosphate hydrolase protein [Piptocephalis tieghemiana]
MTFFDTHRSGDLISRLSADTSLVGRTLSGNLSDGLRSLAMSTAGLSMMVYVSGKLTAVMMIIVPPIAVISVIYGRYVKELSRKTQGALGDITKVAEERIGNIRTVQAFTREKDEVVRYDTRVQEVFNLAKKEAMASGIFFGGAGLSGNLTVLAVLGMGGNMVMNQAITVGELTSFLLYTAYVGSSLMGLTSFFSEFMKGVGASARIFEIVDRVSLIPHQKGKITFEDVHFSYPTRSDTAIFRGLDFTVNPDTVLAIAGASGGGKSTIASLVLRYYDPQGGRILVDGVDLRDLDLAWWRNQVGIVSQEPTLFAGTIEENIAYGRSGSTPEEVRNAAEQANCTSFIQSFPNGFDTYVGERGISLSGGQKQRIAIARALLKNPTVLILDEATSALDAESEHLVQDALDRLTQNRTVLTIAHRPSTLAASDVVMCLRSGRMGEMGPFSQLMLKEDGVFRSLMEHQVIDLPSDDEEGESEAELVRRAEHADALPSREH